MRAWLAILVLLLAAAGCGGPAVPRERITFAVLGGVYYAAGPGADVPGAMLEDSPVLLAKAVADLNRAKDLDFVVVAGDLLARADGPSVDRAKAVLDELRVPYFVVLGEHDGPAAAALTSPAASVGAASSGAAGSREPASDAGACGLSRTAVVWAFQGRGFSGPEGYWSREVLPGLVLVGLDTVRPGAAVGRVDARQLEWLERALSAHAGKAVIVIAYHELMPMHPLDEGAAWQHKVVENAPAVRQVLQRHPNVLAVLAGNCHFAEGRVAGRVLYLSSPSVSVWPLAYLLVRLTPREAEAVWVALGDDNQARRAQERLLRTGIYRGVFPAGEDGDTACVRLFGGKKVEVYPLPGIRP